MPYQQNIPDWLRQYLPGNPVDEGTPFAGGNSYGDLYPPAAQGVDMGQPQNHLAQMLDAYSNQQATRQMAQPNPLDAQLFAQGGEQAMQQMGPNPRQWPTSDPRGVMSGQMPIDQHLAARFAPQQGGAYQLNENVAARNRADQQALTAAMDARQAGGQYRGGGTTPFAYMDNQIVTPDALQPTRGLRPDEQMQIEAALANIGNDGGQVFQDSGPTKRPIPDQRVQIPAGTGQPINFRSGAGAAYVDANRSILDAMKAGVDPTILPQNVLQGNVRQEDRANIAAQENDRKIGMQARIQEQRDADKARRMDNAGVIKSRKAGMNPLQYRLYQMMGNGDAGSAMDILEPQRGIERQKIAAMQEAEKGRQDIARKGQEGEAQRHAAELASKERMATLQMQLQKDAATADANDRQQKMALTIQQMQNEMANQQRQFGLQEKELGIKSTAAKQAPYMAAIGSQNPDAAEWGMNNLIGQGGGQQATGAASTIRQAATLPAKEALERLLLVPGIENNPELIRSALQKTPNLQMDQLRAMLQEIDPQSAPAWSNLRTDQRFPENRGWNTAGRLVEPYIAPTVPAFARQMTTIRQLLGQEDAGQTAARTRKIALIKALLQNYAQ